MPKSLKLTVWEIETSRKVVEFSDGRLCDGQVEHPVTEWISHVNIPSCQLMIGMGVPLHRIPDIRRLFGKDTTGHSRIDFDMDPQQPPSGPSLLLFPCPATVHWRSFCPISRARRKSNKTAISATTFKGS